MNLPSHVQLKMGPSGNRIRCSCNPGHWYDLGGWNWFV